MRRHADNPPHGLVPHEHAGEHGDKLELQPRPVGRSSTQLAGAAFIFLGGLMEAAGASSGHHRSSALPVTGAALCIGGAVALFQRWTATRTRLRVSGASLSLVRPLWGRTLTQRGPIRRIVQVDVMGDGRGLPRPRWVVVNERGEGVIVLNRDVWPREEIERLAYALEASVETRKDRAPLSALANEFTGAIRWWEIHRALAVIGVTIMLILVATCVLSFFGVE